MADRDPTLSSSDGRAWLARSRTKYSVSADDVWTRWFGYLNGSIEEILYG